MSQISKHVLLNPAEKAKLKKACSNRLNWSDGGHWIGTGKAPNCFANTHLSSEISHTYRFPTDASANRWNMEWEKNIRYMGHFGTVGLTIALGVMGGSWGAASAAIFLPIMKDELQAKIPYPKMARGWNYQVTTKYQYQWSPHPLGTNGFTISTRAIIRDHQNQVIKQKQFKEHYLLDDLPDGLAEQLASQTSRNTTSDYR